MAISGSCHCGATRFEIDAVEESLTRCTCSFCSKRGGLWTYCRPDQFRLLATPSADTVYRWGSQIGKHHFCPVCGCGTFSEFPDFSTGEADFDNPRISINAHLLDGFDAWAHPITVIDGRNLW